jgi:DNA/RNA-binding domain of Phe-tRNA-synthetase-like protein
MSGEPDATASDPRLGWIAREVRAEFPELKLWTMTVDARPQRSNAGLRERLRTLSSRFHGARAIKLRTDPVPHAYRVFFRHVGLDPDTDRTPVEAAALDRLVHGGFRSEGLVQDALLIAVAETGVPMWALDEATVRGELGIRLAGDRERLGRSELAPDLAPGRLVVADDESAVAELFGDPAPGHGVGSETTALRVFTVQPAGVPTIHVEEALWLVVEALDSAE